MLPPQVRREGCRLLQIDLPKLLVPINSTVGWDKNAHRVKSISIDANHRLSGDLELGCQPSGEGAVLKAFRLKPEQLRLSEDLGCTGTVSDDHSVSDLACRPSGAVGKLVGAIKDLNGQLKPIFKTALSR